jgi:hypothetical protein
MDLESELMLEYVDELLNETKQEKVNVLDTVQKLTCDYCSRMELGLKNICNHCESEFLGFEQPKVDPNKELVEKHVNYRNKVANSYYGAIRFELNEVLNKIFEFVAYNDFCELYKDRQQSIMDLMRWIYNDSVNMQPIVEMELLVNVHRWVGNIWEDLAFLNEKNCFRHVPEYSPLLQVMISFYENISAIIEE